MASYLELQDMGPRLHYDAINMMLGVKLGSGCSRRVFVNDLNPTQVVKINHGAGFENVQEWLIWQEVQHKPELAKWFAPCVSISPNGLVLIQERTRQPRIAYPDKVPSIFTDLKQTNWGELDGRIVCHDYALFSRLYSITKRLRKADWWHLAD